jgi:hypothetical protein
MDFRSSIASSRSYTVAAIAQLDRLDPSKPLTAPVNVGVLDATKALIASGATHAGADAIEAARWDRRVGIGLIRATGSALEQLDSAWWGLTGRNGASIDVVGARRALLDAVAWLDRAAGPRWATAPLAA